MTPSTGFFSFFRSTFPRDSVRADMPQPVRRASRGSLPGQHPGVLSGALICLLSLLALPSAMAAPAAPPGQAQPAPALRWQTLEGGNASLAQWKGKPVLLNYWASWCGPCLKELPDLQRLSERQTGKRHGLRVVGIALDDAAPAAALRDRLQLTYLQLVEADGPPGSAARFGNAAGTLPFSVLLDAEGRVLRTHHGPLDAKALDAWAAAAGAGG